MQNGFKIAIGGGVTALLAVIAHGPLGLGTRFVAGLQRQADAAMAEAGLIDLKVRLPSDPLSRTAIISGTATDDERRLAIAALSGISGIGAIRLAAPAPAAPPPSGAAGACDAALDRAVAGRTLSFRQGSAYLSPESNRILHDVAGALKQCPQLHVEIAGHSNRTGSAAINMAMSEDRAKRVRDALVAGGVAATALRIKGYGASQPIAAHAPADPANRRVTLRASKDGG